MFGENIGNEKRRADEKQADIAARKKVIFGSAFLPREVHADAKYDGEIDPDDHEVYRCQVAVRDRDLRRKQHLCLLGNASLPAVPQLHLHPEAGARSRLPLPLRDLLETDAREVYNTKSAGSMARD